MKHRLLFICTFLVIASHAAVPLRWTVETSRVQPAVFEAVRGETLELEATLTTYGRPLDLTGKTASIYWQTNGMDSAWWTTNATIAASNRISAVFTPAMDPGASAVIGYLGVAGDVYRAAFMLRFRHGPGEAPNSLPLPQQTIDFTRVTVLNPPWPTNAVTVADLLAATNAVLATANAYADATAEDLAQIDTKVEQSLIYSSGIYQYMAGNTNAWFSATNYVTTADGTTRTRFAWEEGMDAGTVPPSMSLWEIRDGQKTVWDQRDWTVWFWNFKSAQLSNNLARVTGNLASEVGANYMRRGWAKYTAVRGLDNPDPSILWIDTPKVQLMAGHQWEKIVEVGGAGYWTLTGNGIELSQQDAQSTFLAIKDFEGNACITLRKTSSYLVYCETGTDIVGAQMDAQGRAVFHLTTDVQPTAEFSTTLELDSFVEQGADGCPANYEWTGEAGSWDCHFILKPGITSSSCFARFKSLHDGENVVDHTVPIKLSGGIVFEQDGVTRKIRPTISGGTVTWVVAQ